MTRGLTLSIVLHLVVVVLAIFGLPVLVALPSGRPAAVARGTATQEIGGDLVHAVEPLDDAALAGFMAAVMDGSLARPAPAAVAAHLARFDWDTAAEAAAALVEEMLASQHAGRDHRANSVG